jgi:hypothetical protein
MHAAEVAVFNELLTVPPQVTQELVPDGMAARMEIFVTLALCYLAVGAALFAHPASPAMPGDFDWRRQIGVFRATFPEVLAWPLALWRFGRTLNDPD